MLFYFVPNPFVQIAVPPKQHAIANEALAECGNPLEGQQSKPTDRFVVPPREDGSTKGYHFITGTVPLEIETHIILFRSKPICSNCSTSKTTRNCECSDSEMRQSAKGVAGHTNRSLRRTSSRRRRTIGRHYLSRNGINTSPFKEHKNKSKLTQYYPGNGIANSQGRDSCRRRGIVLNAP